jgi:hypothetical protein
VADHCHVRRCLEPGCGVEEEPESPAFRELADRADDGRAGRYSETISPLGSVGRFEAVLEWHRQNGCQMAGLRMSEIAFEGGVGAQGCGQASIEITVVGITPDVAWAAECAYQRGAAMGAGGDAQEVVVGEVTDDDIALLGQTSDRSDIRSEVCRTSFLDKAGLGPRTIFEASLEVAPADEKQAPVDAGTVQGTTGELGHGTRAGPLVGEDDHADSHA